MSTPIPKNIDIFLANLNQASLHNQTFSWVINNFFVDIRYDYLKSHTLELDLLMENLEIFVDFKVGYLKSPITPPPPTRIGFSWRILLWRLRCVPTTDQKVTVSFCIDRSPVNNMDRDTSWNHFHCSGRTRRSGGRLPPGPFFHFHFHAFFKYIK